MTCKTLDVMYEKLVQLHYKQSNTPSKGCVEILVCSRILVRLSSWQSVVYLCSWQGPGLPVLVV